MGDNGGEGWEDAVLSNFEALVECTLLHTELVVNLFQNKLINRTEMELLMDKRTPNTDRATQLYTSVGVAMEAQKVTKFKEALRKSGNTKALGILNNSAAQPPPPVINAAAPHQPDNAYGDGKRYALIVNVPTNRTGAEKDGEAMEGTLKGCGFEVDVCRDLTRQGIVEAVKQFRDKVKGVDERLGAVVIAVGSHGDNYDFFLSSDGGRLQLTGDIVDQFNGVNCSKLLEVPKVFLVNICRGDKVDGPRVENDGGGGWKSLDEWWGAKGPTRTQSDSTGNSLPTWTNMIVAYASYDGHVAYRDPETGTWFFQEFCGVVKSLPRGMCIKGILDKVSEEVMRKTTERGEKQMPTWKNVGFTRSLIFHYKPNY